MISGYRATAKRAFVALVLLVAATCAGAVTITRNFSASWFDPAHSGHGFNLEVVDNPAGKTMVAFWYTFDASGAPVWIVASGPVVGDRAVLQASLVNGGRFGNGFDPALVQQRAWGTLSVSFADCNNGSVAWSPTLAGFTAGSMPIQRLTQLFGSACTGGVSDDVNSGAAEVLINQAFTNTGAASAASGHVKFEQRASRTEFDIEVEDLPVGAYDVVVGAQVRWALTVVAIPGGTRGEVEFRSPVEPGHVLLDFDPRQQAIAIRRTGTTYLTTTLGQASNTATPPSGSAPPTGSAVHAVRLAPPAGGAASGIAELEQRQNSVEFKVEAEDVAPGEYSVRVAGIERGRLRVIAVGTRVQGEIEFRAPLEPGKLLLDFDPRGQRVDVVAGTTIVLTGVVPVQPTLVGDDQPGNGGVVPVEASVALARIGPDANASGHATYSVTDEVEFEVEVEDLSDGDYVLTVGGVQRATMTVSGERGEVKFSSQPRVGELLLTFDPRGQRVEVSRNGVAYLGANFPG